MTTSRIKNGKVKYIFLSIIILLGLLISGCSCDLGIFTSKTKIKTPNLMADYSKSELQWEKIDNINCYDIYQDDKVITTINSTTDIVTFNYSDYVENNEIYEFSIIAKATNNKYADSDNSNLVVVDNRLARNGSASNYTFSKSLTNINPTWSDKTINWSAYEGASEYLISVFTNTTGYVEIKTESTSFNFASNGFIKPHQIIAYNISAITGKNTATIISPKINYYNPDDTDTDSNSFIIITFDGLLWDNYINSTEELNANVYYNFICRNSSYDIYFDENYADSISTNTIGGRSVAMKEAVNDAFSSFYETSYFEPVNKTNYGSIDSNNNLKMTIALNFFNVAECNINLPSQNKQEQAEDDVLYSDVYDFETNGKREDTFDNFQSDKYFLTTYVTTSEQLYHAVENKITPICAKNSRAETIYNMAKDILREIISDSMTDYEKALSIFDWITYNTTYDYYSLNQTNSVFTKFSCYYLEGVFIDHLAVCDGFSKAFSLMCNMEGIDCIRIVGDAVTSSGSGGHAWNKVKINNEYELVDITWTELNQGATENLSHKYFLVSENSTSATHFPYAQRTKFFAYATPIKSNIDYYNTANFYYIDVNGTKQTCSQLIDSDADLQSALDFSLYANLNWVEMAVDYDYLVALTEELNEKSAITAFQKKLKELKYNPLLITQCYDASKTVNFMYRNGKYYTIVKLTTTLLVNEQEEFKKIVNDFGSYATKNNNVYDTPIEFGFDSAYLQEALGITAKITSDNVESYVRQFINKIKFTIEYPFTITNLNLSESMYINSNDYETIVYYFSLTILRPGSTQLNRPSNVQLNGSIVSWDSVDNATGYKVLVNGTQRGITENTEYDLSEITSAGDYEITIIATCTGYIDSDISSSVTLIILQNPEVTISGNTIFWDKVEHATKYKVYEKFSNESTNLLTEVDASTMSSSGQFSFNYTLSDTGVIHYLYVVAIFEDQTSISNDVCLIKLSQPTLSISNTTISWGAVLNANRYELYINGSYKALLQPTNPSSTSLSYNLSTFVATPGYYEIYLIAINNAYTSYNNISIISSDRSNSVNVTTTTTLSAPAITLTNSELKWEAIDNADSYSIYNVTTNTNIADGITTTSFDLSTITDLSGFYTICVKAINSSSSYYLDSDSSNTIDYAFDCSSTLSISGNSLSWNTITNATNYIVYNGTEIIQNLNSSNTNSYTLTTNPCYYNDLKITAKYNSLSYTTNSVSYLVIDKPVLSLNSSLLSWTSIANATSYSIYVNDIEKTTITDLLDNYSYDLENIITTNDTYSIYVIANSDISVNSYTSGRSTSISYIRHVVSQLPAPVISISNSTISWSPINNATEYKIYNASNDSNIATTSETSFDLSTLKLTAGDYEIYVKAYSSDSNYSISNASNSILYTVEEPEELASASPNINYDTNILSWDSVSNATGYKFYLDNIYKTTTTSTSITLTNYVSDNNIHSVYIIPTDSSNTYKDASTYTKLIYQLSPDTTWDLADDIIVYSNSVLSPNATVALNNTSISTDDQLTWNVINYASGYTILISLGGTDIYTYDISNKSTNSISLSTIYNNLSFASDEIIAYCIVANVGSKKYVSDFESSYYNPYTDTNYNSVYAFDGDLNDFYITTQEQFNNVAYYAFIERFASTSIQITSTIYNNFSTYYSNATSSFRETSYMSMSYSYGSNTATIIYDFLGVSECNINYYENRSVTPDSYSIDTDIAKYSDIYDYSTNGYKSSAYASDNRLIKINVSTSEELYFAVENKYTPICASGSRAETIYQSAKEAIENIISDNMSEFEKVLSIYEWISDNTTYDHTIYNTSVTIETDYMKIPSYYLEGVFIKKLAVCDGFSKAFSLMCNMLDIDCIRIVGEAGNGENKGGYAWNKVLVDGNYYVVDITWSNNPFTIDSTTSEVFDHNYFLVTDSYISSTHVAYANRTKFANYSTANTPYNYYGTISYDGTSTFAITSDDDTTKLINMLKTKKLTRFDIVVDNTYTFANFKTKFIDPLNSNSSVFASYAYATLTSSYNYNNSETGSVILLILTYRT